MKPLGCSMIALSYDSELDRTMLLKTEPNIFVAVYRTVTNQIKFFLDRLAISIVNQIIKLRNSDGCTQIKKRISYLERWSSCWWLWLSVANLNKCWFWIIWCIGNLWFVSNAVNNLIMISNGGSIGPPGVVLIIIIVLIIVLI